MPVKMMQRTAITTQIIPSDRIWSAISMSDAYEVVQNNRKTGNNNDLMDKSLG